MREKPETRFYRKVNEQIPKEVHRQKVGTLMVNGTVDFWYSGFKADCWVEYKWIESVPRVNVDVPRLLSSLQKLWLNLRWQEGRDVLVVVGSHEGCVVLQRGAWNESVPSAFFRLSVSDVSAFLTERLHDSSAAARSRSFSDELGISYLHHFSTNSRDSV